MTQRNVKSPFFPEKTEKDIYLDSQKVITFFTGICACLEIEGAGRQAHCVVTVRHQTEGHTEDFSLMSS